MTSRSIAGLAVLAAIPFACLTTVAICPTATCGAVFAHGGFRWPAALEQPMLLGSLVVLAWALRLGATTARMSRQLAGLPRLPVPLKLARIASAAGVDRIRCIAAGAPIAFCAGLLRPTIYVSDGAITVLSEPELTAVLHHEADHARRWEPARRASRDAVADVLAFLPIIRWWSDRRIERAELDADAAAERAAGKSALAGALLLMTTPTHALAAFTGQTELRASRLLGVEVEPSRPPRTVWAVSIAGAWLALSLAGCLFEVAVALS